MTPKQLFSTRADQPPVHPRFNPKDMRDARTARVVDAQTGEAKLVALKLTPQRTR
ncbi:MAG: hypothetical protein PW734_06095 [Verrucomicrobium sp.]|nr:hypothetical protein [Verrucomicrobium sp.]